MGGVKIMKYYKNTNDRIDSFLTEGSVEITSPVRADGTLLPQHDNLNLVATDTDGKYFKYYLTTPDTEGIYQADTVKIALNDSEAVRVKAKVDMSVALEAMTYTFADGKVVQVRPQDLGNFNIAIASGVAEEWVLKDNTVRTSTVAELTDAMNDGIVQGKAIWANYKAILKTL